MEGERQATEEYLQPELGCARILEVSLFIQALQRLGDMNKK